LKKPSLAAIAIVSGTVVLLGYFLPSTLLSDLRNTFFTWFMILAAVALGIGVFYILRVNWTRLRSGTHGRVNSAILIAALLITAGITIFSGLTSEFSAWVLDFILIPVEASLLAILTVLLISFLGRLFLRGFSATNLIFALTAIFVLTVSAVLYWVDVPWIGEMRDWISQVWSVAGIRAILIGVALGAITTGLRVLLGSDRLYES
jgi:hypothetical protein